ncbi:hypothetical protein Pelo_2868 [Pelomyxa schiedti]|nr:hypothetical protein Pelo_2868 [Pelomyxa schiedti]
MTSRTNELPVIQGMPQPQPQPQTLALASAPKPAPAPAPRATRPLGLPGAAAAVKPTAATATSSGGDTGAHQQNQQQQPEPGQDSRVVSVLVCGELASVGGASCPCPSVGPDARRHHRYVSCEQVTTASSHLFTPTPPATPKPPSPSNSPSAASTSPPACLSSPYSHAHAQSLSLPFTEMHSQPQSQSISQSQPQQQPQQQPQAQLSMSQPQPQPQTQSQPQPQTQALSMSVAVQSRCMRPAPPPQSAKPKYLSQEAPIIVGNDDLVTGSSPPTSIFTQSSTTNTTPISTTTATTTTTCSGTTSSPPEELHTDASQTQGLPQSLSHVQIQRGGWYLLECNDPELFQTYADAFDGLREKQEFTHVFVYHHHSEGIAAFTKHADAAFSNFLNAKSKDQDLFLLVCEQPLSMDFLTFYVALDEQIQQCLVLQIGPPFTKRVKGDAHGFPKKWVKENVAAQLHVQITDPVRATQILDFFNKHSH